MYVATFQGAVKSILKGGHLLIESKFRDEPDFMELRKREPELRKNDFLPAFRFVFGDESSENYSFPVLELVAGEP